MAQGEVALSIEYKVTAHLGQVELLRTPDPSSQDQSDVAPDGAEWCDCSQTPTFGPETLVTGALRIGQPEKGMSQAGGKGFEMFRAGK